MKTIRMFRSQSLVIAVMVLTVLAVLLTVAYLRFVRPPELSEVESSLFNNESGIFVDSTGVAVDLEGYRDSVRVINSWATWSPFSRDELVALNALAGEYRDRGLVVLAVNRDEPQERIDAFLASLPPLPEITFVRDTEDMLYAASAGYTMPETLMYSSDGELLFHKRGAMTLDEMREEAEKAVAAE